MKNKNLTKTSINSTLTKNNVQFTINGKTYNADPDKTILEAALENNLFIPHLCYDERLAPHGACRLCLVEIEGMPEAVPSCLTKVMEGMKVTTNSNHIKNLVKINLELLISDHPLDCMTCESAGNCALQDLAYMYRIKQSRYKGKIHEKKVLEDNPFIQRDNEKCILCGRCIRMCDDFIGANAIGYARRGFDCEIVPAFDQSLKNSGCVFCGNCISTCPVGALQPKPYTGQARPWEVSKIKTTCPYCGVGCQIYLHVKDNKIVNVSADIAKDVNQGNLCVKGRFGLDFVSSPKRLTSPLLKGKNGKFNKISWEKAIDIVSNKLNKIKQKYGPESIGILSSAKCTNEENYLLSKFARAVIETNNIDHCARLCHASTITGLRPTIGSGAMTNSIDDIKYADAAIIIGSNTTEAHPVIGYEIIRCINKYGLKLIVIDPRNIPISKHATVHLKQKPGTDIAVLLGIMNIIYRNNLHDEDFIGNRTEDFDKFIKSFTSFSPSKVERISGVDKKDLEKAAKIYGSAKSAPIFYSMGITQHTCGTDNVSSVANLAMMTGNIGKEGSGVNPLRGQNNVQGACDMGALPNVFSDYQKVENYLSSAKFVKKWGKVLPTASGLTVTEMIDNAVSGKLKALYIMGENPMLSDPDILHVAEGLKNLEFLAIQDIFITETGEFADVILPSACFAEKNGTFTNTERRIQRVRKAVEPPGKAKEDWQIICMLSTALGYPMNYNSPSEIMNEIAETTPTYGGINYERLEKTSLQWPCRYIQSPGTNILHKEFFHREGGKGKFVPVKYSLPAELPDKDYPFILTTGRQLYHFHTRTMSGKVDGLNEIAPIARAHINTEDAASLGIKNNEKVVLKTRRGSIKVSALVDFKIKKGVIFLPFHYADAPANKLTNPALDPKAKIPEFKVCAVSVKKISKAKCALPVGHI
ncbi:MAG: formate dehydrogenase subunit alpha [Actinobacteria bacterium]|nr:formate dehydrogenase subunit alpha [Actinomycetota bacterium]